MTAAVASASPPAPAPAPGPAPGRAPGRPGRTVRRVTARKALRSGVLWGYVFGVYVASQALAYAGTYRTAASRLTLARSFGASGGLNALVGPARDLQTVAGYTAWKSLGILSVLGAVWALLLATKLVRGEEDAGRWEVLLAGQTTGGNAAAQALSGLGAGFAVLLGITAAVTVLVGHSSKVHYPWTSGVFFAMAVTSGALLFLAGGVLASQLAGSRRQAAAYAGGALGVCFAVRVAADASPSLSWLHWATPLGWIEELGPFTDPRPWVLAPVVLLTAALSVTAVHLAGRRDLGTGVLPDRSRARARTGLLGGATGLTVRQIRPTVLGWLAGVGGFGLLLGGVARQAAQSLKASPSVEAALNRLSGHGGVVKAYLGVSFLIVTLMVALIAAGQITAARGEEATGRLEHLVVRPLSRARWMLTRLGVAAGAVTVAGLLGGLCTWLGTAAQGTPLAVGSLVGAGLNTAVGALFLLGLGAVVWAAAPRLASWAVYAALAWSFLVELLGGLVRSNHWLLDTSVFHQLAPAPAVAPDWTTNAALLGLGVAGCLAAAALFTRRDLVGE